MTPKPFRYCLACQYLAMAPTATPTLVCRQGRTEVTLDEDATALSIDSELRKARTCPDYTERGAR